MSRISRRSLLSTGAGGVLAATARSSARGTEKRPDYQVEDQTPFRGQTRRPKLSNGDRVIASLIFPTDYPTHFRLKPELYPVCTPSGFPVTDLHQFCFVHRLATVATGL